MQALVLVASNRLEVQDRPLPRLGDDELLVKVAACGICGSDVHGMDGSTGRRRPPIVMGHEAAGVVVEMGEGVKGWARGDRVTFDSTIYCGACWFCRRGRINLCDHRRVLGVSCDEYRRDGAFAQYVAVPQRILYRLPDAVTFEHAAMVEPLSVALHAVGRTRICLDDTAVVVGAGMIGLLVIQALRVAGCGQILAVDLDPQRVELACRLGADAGLQSDRLDMPAEVLRRTGNRGADLVYEVVGVSPTVHMAAACLRKGGQLALIGNLAPQVDFPLQAAVTRELTFRGSCASCGEYPACLDLMARGAIDLGPLISAVAPLAEGPEWFHRLRAGGEGLIKVILKP